MGFTPKGEEPEPGPNRAQRRAMAKKLRAQQRKGQRAWDKRLRYKA